MSLLIHSLLCSISESDTHITKVLTEIVVSSSFFPMFILSPSYTLLFNENTLYYNRFHMTYDTIVATADLC